MPPRLSWTQLLPGVVAVALLVLVCVGVVVFAGVGSIRGETMRLYVLAEQVRGLIKGSEVWLAGQKVGVVEEIGFRPPSADTLGRVVLTVTVKAEAAQLLRRDSPAEVRTGGSMMGPVVVYIESGAPTSPSVREGDTLRAKPQTDIAIATAKLEAAAPELPALMADARTVIGHVRDPDGTVGAVLSGGAGPGVTRLRRNVTRLRNQMSASGSAGRAGPRTVMRHASQALARADSIRTLLRSPNTSYGRFRRDSTLVRSIASVRDELAEISVRMEAERGTLYRVKNDSAIAISVAAAKREMALLFADLRRRPLRYLQF